MIQTEHHLEWHPELQNSKTIYMEAQACSSFSPIPLKRIILPSSLGWSQGLVVSFENAGSLVVTQGRFESTWKALNSQNPDPHLSEFCFWRPYKKRKEKCLDNSCSKKFRGPNSNTAPEASRDQEVISTNLPRVANSQTVTWFPTIKYSFLTQKRAW